MIYVLTVSDAYYPLAGAEDWVFVTRDLEAAKLRAGTEITDPHYQSAHVLAINEDNLHVQEVFHV